MEKYKVNRKLGKVICNQCHLEFYKPLSEIKRNKEKNRNNYCSRKCSGHNVGLKNLNKSNSDYDISKHSGNRLDEFTPFRRHHRVARNRFKEVTITLSDLKHQWESQNGVCPYSKVILNHDTKDIRYRASLDRIDSSKGYIKDNIQFVSCAINYMKCQMSDIQTKDFINQIVLNNSCYQED